MNHTWSVVFSALFGAGCGVLFAYSSYKFFENKIHSSLFHGAVIVTIPFAIYFSVEQSPLLTPLFYFLPIFGAVFRYVSSLILEQKEEEARKGKEPEPVDGDSLRERIKKLKEKNQE